MRFGQMQQIAYFWRCNCNPEHINVRPMYFIKTPDFVKSLFPGFLWSVKDDQKSVYLTFDDGPVPQVTPWVLDKLAEFDAKATFFCVGENIDRYPDTFQKVLDAGHQVGNHTYSHIAGWETDNVEYFRNIRKCAHLVKTDLFRPPYGKMKPKQVEFINRHYKIVMWDVLSGDFDDENTPERCYKNVANNAKSGSIIVFHDSLKSFPNLKVCLPKILQYLSEQGYSFRSIESERVFVPQIKASILPSI
jgi:peptidoglycan/xylan/chitin deacetylase (PgdA/CDA1 family)